MKTLLLLLGFFILIFIIIVILLAAAAIEASAIYMDESFGWGCRVCEHESTTSDEKHTK